MSTLLLRALSMRRTEWNKEVAKDELLIAKLFFYFVDILKPFLKAYQHDRPMVLLLLNLFKVIKNISFHVCCCKTKLVYKKKSLLNLKLLEIDLSKADNLPSAENMNIGFAASAHWKFDKEGCDFKDDNCWQFLWKCESMFYCFCE